MDNHFDKDCISGLYRLTTPGGEVDYRDKSQATTQDTWLDKMANPMRVECR